MIKRSRGERIFECFNIVFMIFLIIVMIYPLLYVIFASFSNYYELIRFKGLLLHPLGFNVDSYKEVFKNPLMLSGFKNTLIIVIAGTAINMFLTILGSYALSRDDLMFKKPAMLFIIFTMYFSGGMIPLYLVVKNLGLIDSLLAVMLPNAISTYNMLLLINGFKNVPKSLEESARIDGAREFRIFNQIVLPLMKPALAVQMIFTFVSSWNNYFIPSLLINKASKKTLPLLIAQLRSADFLKFDMGQVYMMIAFAIVPVIIVYICLSKFIVRGVTLGGVKG